MMKNNWKWAVGAAFALLILIALPFVLRGFGYFGMMGGWHRPMMGGFGYFPVGGFWMGFGMILMWLVPLGLLFLAVYGVVSLVNKPNLPASSHNCPNCARSVQMDWKHCPNCGTSLQLMDAVAGNSE